ncbi:MAG: NAD(P)-dependent glycerol-3-phosphate dehydrogenase [Mollicutes bacterium]|jgi:glycerol-3-phosphate dehydrogenase (NAD(P)+)|nr:NAD(P)-dependent glycerol-3-phosphate dehydrogenase [Mollicutes bacterium]
MKVAILGPGAYGLSLAEMFNKNNCQITMWSKFTDEIKELDELRISKKLPNYKIPKNIKFTTDMEECVTGADLIVIAVPAGHVDTVSLELKNHYQSNQHLCIASKGIEQDTCLFVHDVVSKYIKTKKLAVISGPSFAIDIVSGYPIGLSLGTTNASTEKILKETLQNDRLKLRTSNDITGIEICGSIKNVIAIAAGMLDGLGANESTQAMFITESLHDIKGLIKALGGDKKTILSFAGFGDLLLTCTSTKSRNFTYGHLIGSKKSKKEIAKYIKSTTIEGLYTLESIYELINNKKVDMPIIDLIYDIIFKNKNPEHLLKFLIEKE